MELFYYVRILQPITLSIMLTQASKLILTATGLSLALSIYLFFFLDSPDAKLYGIYVGLWVPSILGAYRVIQTGQTDGTDDK